MADWTDHVPEEERGGLLTSYDDGSAVFMSSTTGGASAAGSWGKLTLMRVLSDGTTEFRDYAAKGDWIKSPFREGE